MKILRNIWIGLLLLCSVVSFSACSDDDEYPEGPLPGWEYDFNPIDITIYVTDSEGNDLLNPDAENTIVNNGIKALYKGEEYVMHWEPEYPPASRAIPVIWSGLQACKPYKEGGRYYLTFGNFDRMAYYENEEFVIDWGDGSWNTVFRFSNSFWWENHKPQNVFCLYVNGEKQKEGWQEVTIVK